MVLVSRTPTVSIIHVFPICNVTALVPKWHCWLLMCAPSQIRQKNYHSMLVPCHDTMSSFMIFRRVLDLQELKNQVSQSFRPSHDAKMFEMHSRFLHGTYKFTQRHTCDFSTNFGALELVFVVQIWIMHIKCPETQLMYKRPNESGISPKFSTVLLFGLICQCKEIKVGEGSVCISFRTRRWHVPSRNHEPS